jgi:hypothetical protein
LQWQAPGLAQGVVETDDVYSKAARHRLNSLDDALHLVGYMKQQTARGREISYKC